jgi:glucose-6-phosphate isomerase
VPAIKQPKQLKSTWNQLNQLAKKHQAINIVSELNHHPDQSQQRQCQAAGLTIDYSRQRLTEEALSLLLTLPKQCGLAERIDDLFSGKSVNPSENRAALHTSLRDYNNPDTPHASLISNAQDQLASLCEKLHRGALTGADNSPITNIVNIGIGGSDLGPRMVNEALSPYQQGNIKVHFVANIDPSDLQDTLAGLSPKNTLFILASKSFSTQETLHNGLSAKQWLLAGGVSNAQLSQHFIAITSNSEVAKAFGIDSEYILPLWPWVGGRYSLWSTIGLPIALANGVDTFHRLLAGARAMDQHFRDSPAHQNGPVILALLEVWYVNFFDTSSVAVIPYDQRLNKFSDYLQQLTMESNGKSCDLEGNTVGYQTSPVIWGCEGSNGQHSFHQLLHQGSPLIPVDFILPLQSHNELNQQHQLLVANCLSQSLALTQGKDYETVLAELRQQGLGEEEASALAHHKVIPGNKPNTIISFDKTTPENLGALIALYEHKVFTQSVIWNINPFDQWGVELGKQISTQVNNALEGKQAAPLFTEQYIQRFRELNQ